MKKAIALAALICAIASIGTGSPSAASKARKFSPHQEPRGIGNLVAHGDRVTLVYDAGVKSATGFAYVRNDLRRKFVRLALAPEPGRGPASTFRARVPARLIRGHRLRYYAVLREHEEPAHGSSSRPRNVVGADPRPARDRRSRHARFGETRSPDQVVARAQADQVGWQLPPPGRAEGRAAVVPRSAPDHSIWLHDSFNDRMLVWNAGRPEHDRALGSAARPYRRQRRRARAERLAVRDARRRARPRLPHRPQAPHRDRGQHVDGTARRRLLRRSAVLRDRDEQRAPRRARRDAARARGHVRPPGRRVRLDAGRDARRPARSRCGQQASAPTGRISRSARASAWSPRSTRPCPTGPARGPRRDRQPPRQRRPRVARHQPDGSTSTTRRDVLRGAPTLVLDATEGEDTSFKWEYEVLRLVPTGARCPSQCRTWSSATTSCRTCG